ncbi:MAG TPA: hypothetical protein VKB93_05080 [Thermoanaerobaculia bacterium]|nr:hypothetical protein [Thermoanaerobaculia bacterium]
MMAWLSLVAGVVVAFLCWNLYRRFGADRISALVEKRRRESRIVSRGEFVEGSRHMEVALALTGSTFFYENADMQASLELQWVTEVEYDTHLSTGVAAAGKVLRLRCYSQLFEFILPNDLVPRWHMMLPPRRGSEPVVLAVPVPALVPVMGA